MSSLPATAVGFYRYVVGVDTRAATHSYAVVGAPQRGVNRSSDLPDHARWSGTRKGLDRSPDRR